MKIFFRLALTMLPAVATGLAIAQDVNNPAGSIVDRPQGPPSAPGIMMPNTPMAAPSPTTTDQNAPVDQRASPFPPASRPKSLDRETAGSSARNPNASGQPRANGF
jgi:uncharacterized membrane protein